jgi:hypothetical protein
MILTVYIDESGTHGAPLMILGGAVMRLGQVQDFNKKWSRLLRNEGVDYFHGREVRNRNGQFAGWSVIRRNDFVERAAKIWERTTLFGFSVRLNQEDYSTRYVGGSRLKGIHYDSPYGLCFRSSLTWLPSLVSDAVNRDEPTLDFVLEDGHKNCRDAIRIFHEVKNSGDVVAKYLGQIVVRDKRRVYALQAADAIVYPAFRGETKELPPIERPPDSTYADDRRRVGSRSPLYRCDVNASYMTELRETAEAKLTPKVPIIAPATRSD